VKTWIQFWVYSIILHDYITNPTTYTHSTNNIYHQPANILQFRVRDIVRYFLHFSLSFVNQQASIIPSPLQSMLSWYPFSLWPVFCEFSRDTSYYDVFLDQKLISHHYSSCCCSCCSSCWGNTLQKSLRLRRFKSDWDDIWQHCSSSKYASTDGVGFSIWHHGGDDVTSRRKVLPFGECTRSICPEHMEHRPSALSM